MTPEERAAYIGAQFPVNGITYTYEGIRFNVQNCVVTGPMVQVDITAWTGSGGNRRDLPLGDGVFRFVNPPLMVADSGTEVITDHRGEQFTRKTFVRNDLLAAQQMVYDAVVACATRLGWTP